MWHHGHAGTSLEWRSRYNSASRRLNNKWRHRWPYRYLWSLCRAFPWSQHLKHTCNSHWVYYNYCFSHRPLYRSLWLKKSFAMTSINMYFFFRNLPSQHALQVFYIYQQSVYGDCSTLHCYGSTSKVSRCQIALNVYHHRPCVHI